MNRHATAEKKIAERLREPYEADPAPAPPEGLRTTLLREVPERLELSPEVAGGSDAASGRPPRWLLAAAATVLIAVGAGVVAVRVTEEADVRPEVRDEAAMATRPSPSTPAPPPPPPADAADAAPDHPEVELEKVPTERDPWSAVTQTPGTLSDGITVGDVAEREEAVFVAPRTANDESSFAVDGVVITDMAAIGSSPTYYDFDQLEEAQAAGETVTVTSEAPLLDARKSARGVSVSPAEIEKVPTAGDPWSVATQSAGVLSDRVNAEPAPLRVPPAQLPPSTGGTTEPNDRPYGDVFFEGYGTNPFLDPAEDPLSTFALDVDTGSYTVVRRFVTDGHRPPADAVRVEEMVNAFDYGDPAPTRPSEGDFALRAEGSRSPFALGAGESPQKERYHLLRFGIRAREVAAADRKPAVLTFVVDVSGSMAAENRLGLVKRSLGLLLDELREDDRVGLVIYGSSGRVVLEPTGDHAAIRRAIDGLGTDGSTNAEEGIALGYDVARRYFREGGINRVILCSDGVANVGRTGPESILERIGAEARRGIELTTVGFGMGNYNDVLMEQLANRGDGAYAYVDRLEEARRVFVENLTGTLQTVARDAKVQVELVPGVVERYRLIGYENRDVPDEKFRDDTVDAGEVGAGHGVTALYELRLREDAPARATAAVLRLRYRSADSGEVVELERPVTVREVRREWESAPASLRLASVVAELAEILRGSYWAKDGDLDDLFRKAQRVAADRPGDVRVAELATMIGRLAAMETGSE